jgi:hypothetical protein
MRLRRGFQGAAKSVQPRCDPLLVDSRCAVPATGVHPKTWNNAT